MKNLIYLISFLVFKLTAQTISPQVINSAGNSNTVSISGTNYFVAYNIGEPIVTTVGSGTNIVTQGFLQTFGERLIVDVLLIKPISCKAKKDAVLKLDTIKTPLNSKLFYNWYFNGLSICTGTNCITMNGLASGTYTIVASAYCNTCTIGTSSPIVSTQLLFVIPENNADCDSVTVYSAFSPNADGLNDVWVIKNMEKQSNATVSIYNRWGVLINSFSPYTNSAPNVWDGTDKAGHEVPSGTYFYVIEGLNNLSTKKGWVEVTGR